MSRATLILLATLTLSSFAKEKQKAPMPFTVLDAHTVVVVVDPDVGRSVRDPHANETAQRDVETALNNWGRFQITMSTVNADLIIVLRKGSDRLVNETIPDPRQNGRVGTVEPLDHGIAIGAQHGTPPNPTSRPTTTTSPSSAPTQTEVSNPDDSFVVYLGGSETPLDSPPIWRYLAKDGLKPHTVPAVDAFRKALAETEKAASKNP